MNWTIQLGAIAVLLASSASAASYAVVNRRIEPDQTLSRALHDASLSDLQVRGVIGALTGLFDFRRSRAGDQIRAVFQDGQLEVLDYRQSPFDEWQVRRDQDRWIGVKRQIELQKKVEMVELRIQSSLYESTLAAGEDPTLALALADVFAWDVDFYQDVRNGDRARAIVEKFSIKGRTLRYGEVLAASYRGQTVGEKRVFRYQLAGGDVSYFQQDGSSARKAFLKSPLKYSNVTSRFGSRFHPILKYVREHNGVDYSAAVGTPVWAVADGTITKIGREGGAGNALCIRHMNSLETCYLHLSRFAPGAHVGARVSQKQVVAFSGSTGLSTGPHLHFALKRGGRYVNPLNQKFPRASPVPSDLKSDFGEKIGPWVNWLNAESVAEAAAPAKP